MTEENEETKAFYDGVNQMKEELNAIAEKWNASFVLGVYFKKEEQSGVLAFNTTNHIEELGIAKLIEQKFIS